MGFESKPNAWKGAYTIVRLNNEIGNYLHWTPMHILGCSLLFIYLNI